MVGRFREHRRMRGPFRVLPATLAAILLAPAAAGAGVQRPFGLVAECPFSHRAPDDPIVYPRMPGASHSHDFFGNRSTDSRSTARRLRRRGTTCGPPADRSAYWAPTLSDRSGPLRPRRARFYYVVVSEEAESVRPHPLGLRIIAGNEHRRETAVRPRYGWRCTGTTVTHAAEIPRCARGQALELRLRFPDCWDGRALDSRDHRSHMAYGSAGRCPGSHPVAVPQLRFQIRYRVRAGRRLTLSSGPTWTTHGDFINAWEPAELERRLRDCVSSRSCVEERSDAEY
jgi:hypothetical protein